MINHDDIEDVKQRALALQDEIYAAFEKEIDAAPEKAVDAMCVAYFKADKKQISYYNQWKNKLLFVSVKKLQSRIMLIPTVRKQELLKERIRASTLSTIYDVFLAAGWVPSDHVNGLIDDFAVAAAEYGSLKGYN